MKINYFLMISQDISGKIIDIVNIETIKVNFIDNIAFPINQVLRQ
jgi:hypothetical protein